MYIYICISYIYTHLYAHTDTHTYTYHWLEAPLFLLRTRTLVQTGQCGKKGAWVLLQLPAHLHAVCVCVAHIWAAVPGSTDSCSKEELCAEADGLRLRPLASEVCVLGMPKAIQALCIHVAFLSSSYSPPLCVVFFLFLVVHP